MAVTLVSGAVAGQAEAVSLWVAVYFLPVALEVRVRVRVWSSAAALTPCAWTTHCSPKTCSDEVLPSPIVSLSPLTVQVSLPSTKPSGVTLASKVSPFLSPLGTDFTDLMATVRDGLRSAVDALEEERGALGATEQRLEATSARHAEVTVALKTQLAGIEEVDMAATISRLQATQTQLEASYRAISLVSGLTLTRFLA